MMWRVVAVFIVGLLMIVSIGAVLALGVTTSTTPFVNDRGEPLPDSIATVEAVELGGMEQWISIRGVDRSQPVLLWLHGGPGSAQMALAHELDGRLEQEFVVVHWDQRGAGKSNPRGFDEATMTFERYVSDARELVEHLQDRLDVDRIYLLGHSWGTQVGIHLAERHPEDLHAYIGVSQVVDNRRAVAIARDWLVDEITERGDLDDLEHLEQLDDPGTRHSEYREFAQLVNAYGGSFDLETRELATIMLRAPEYTARDYIRLLRGMNRGGAPLHDDGIMAPFDLIEQIPHLEVPVYFIVGANDYNTPATLVAEYHEALEAPDKDLFVFEDSAHLPFLGEKDRFDQVIIDLKQTPARR